MKYVVQQFLGTSFYDLKIDRNKEDVIVAYKGRTRTFKNGNTQETFAKVMDEFIDIVNELRNEVVSRLDNALKTLIKEVGETRAQKLYKDENSSDIYKLNEYNSIMEQYNKYKHIFCLVNIVKVEVDEVVKEFGLKARFNNYYPHCFNPNNYFSNSLKQGTIARNTRIIIEGNNNFRIYVTFGFPREFKGVTLAFELHGRYWEERYEIKGLQLLEKEKFISDLKQQIQQRMETFNHYIEVQNKLETHLRYNLGVAKFKRNETERQLKYNVGWAYLTISVHLNGGYGVEFLINDETSPIVEESWYSRYDDDYSYVVGYEKLEIKQQFNSYEALEKFVLNLMQKIVLKELEYKQAIQKYEEAVYEIQGFTNQFYEFLKEDNNEK